LHFEINGNGNTIAISYITSRMNRILGLLLIVLAIKGCSGERSRDGDNFFNKKEYQNAIDAYNDYLEARPNDLEIIYKRGRAYEELGDDQEALSNYNFILTKDVEYPDAHMGIGNYYYRTNDYESALFYYDKAMAKDRSNAIGYLQKGKTHQRLGNLQEAMADYNSAISINDSKADFYIARGSLRLVMKQSSVACGDFRIAKSLGSIEADDIINEYCH
jgi:tetratricopeptide (TPR) repeat protein